MSRNQEGDNMKLGWREGVSSSGLRIIGLAAAWATIGMSGTCRADILFIDLNDAPTEIAAAKAAAATRGENLVLFPQRTDDQQKILDQLHVLELQKIKVLSKEYEDWRRQEQIQLEIVKLQKEPNPDQAKIAALTAQQQQYISQMYTDMEAAEPQTGAINEQEAQLGNTVNFSLDDFQSFIDSYKSKPNPITTVIFSGHHDTLSYTGILGTISIPDVIQAIKNDPTVLAGIRAVYGWDCYSADPSEMEWWLGQGIPNLDMIVGYDAGAPSSAEPVDYEYLQGALEQEGAIRALADNPATAHDVSGIASLIRAIPGFRIANSAICTRDVCVGMNTGAIDLSKQAALCSQQELDQLNNDYQRFLTVLEATTSSVEDIPCETVNPDVSWLRAFYNNLKDHAYCGADLGPLMDQFANVTKQADTVIRLIDFRQIYENFKLFYAADFKALKAIRNQCSDVIPDWTGQIKCAAPPQELASSTISRNGLIGFSQTLENLSDGGQSCGNTALTSDQLQTVQTANQDLQLILGQLKCVPLSWVNPPAADKPLQKPDPSCVATGFY